MTRPTEGFLCPMGANTYGIDFLQFTISDYDSKKIIFEVGKDSPPPADLSIDFSTLGEDMYRKIKYNFSEDVLRLPFVQTTLVFSVGTTDVRDFRMIERHYFRDQLVKSFDFEFGFCIPGSVNTWDAIYSVPPLNPQLIEDMINNPFETKSDSFYFVDGKLIMHNKASYSYLREDAAQAKRSYEDKFGYKGSKQVKSAAKAAAKESPVGAKRVEEVSDGVQNMEVADAKEPSPTAAAAAPAKAAKGSAQQWSKETDYF